MFKTNNNSLVGTIHYVLQGPYVHNINNDSFVLGI